jgi:hypothetical protein
MAHRELHALGCENRLNEWKGYPQVISLFLTFALRARERLLCALKFNVTEHNSFEIAVPDRFF